MMVDASNDTVNNKKHLKKRQIVGVITLFLFVVIYFSSNTIRIELNHMVSQIARGDLAGFQQFLLSFGVWAPVLSFLMMVTALIIAPLPAFVITFTNGLVFGAFWGTILSWTSAMTGAALCFWIGRTYGRPVVDLFAHTSTIEWMDRFISKYGFRSIFIARLIPVLSFAIVSYVSGLTPIRFSIFFLATGIGQLPATILYSVLGKNAEGTMLYLFWAFVAVVVLIVIGSMVKPLISRRIGKEVS